MTVPSTKPTLSLADHCTGVVKLGCSLTVERSTAAEQLAEKFHQLFIDLESRTQRAGIPSDAVQLAKYALCAWIDERILASDLQARVRWASEPLQLRYFDEFSAGEEFYAKLESVRAAPGSGDVLEVYGLCLALGFRGKLGDERGLERRRLLLQQIASEVRRARGPEAERPRIQEQAILAHATAMGVLDWVVPVMSASLVVLAWVVVEAWVGGAVRELATTIGEVAHGS